MKRAKIDEARRGMDPEQSDSGPGYTLTSVSAARAEKTNESSWVRIVESKKQNTKQK